MFLLFCLKLWRDVKRDLKPCSPVVKRLLCVIHYVYSRDIKPKNGVYQIGGKSAQWELIRTTWENFDAGFRDLHNLVLILKVQGSWADGREFTSSIEETLKKVEEKLRCAKDVSEANGFVRDAMESNILDLWTSLFDKETEEAWTLKVMREEILIDLFQPILSESWHSEIPTLHVYSSYIPGKHFAKQELKEEVVRLGVEVSLYVAESMFLLCDDIHSMLRFCWNIWRDVKRDLKHGSPVGDRLLRVSHYVYSRHIKPKNGVYQIGCKSVQWELIRKTWENSDAGIRDLHNLVSFLRLQGKCPDGRVFTSSIETALKKVDENMRCAKDVSEANGFLRDAMESNIWDLWKSLFDKETEEAWTLKVMRDEILSDMFKPLLKEEAASKH